MKNLALPEVISDFMSYYGCIVSSAEHDTLEYLAPKNLIEALGIPELGKIAFTRHSSPEQAPAMKAAGQAVYASYDSDLTRLMREFISQKGVVCAAAYPAGPINMDKCLNQISRTVYFSNATFRVREQQTRDVIYDLVFFKYTAVSDDQQEGLVAVLRNTLNGCMSIVSKDVLPELFDQMSENGRVSSHGEDIEKSIRLARCAANIAVRKKTEDFVKSSEKRLNRDIQRISGYYAQLTEETQKMLNRVQTQAGAKEEQIKRLRGKHDAIDHEMKWKIQDMKSKYTLEVTVDPVVIVRVTAMCPVFWIDIRRRMETRPLALAFNPLLKQLDSIFCEACFNPHGERLVCDTRLHIICPECLAACPVCAKKYCKACFPKCPRCPASSISVNMSNATTGVLGKERASTFL